MNNFFFVKRFSQNIYSISILTEFFNLLDRFEVISLNFIFYLSRICTKYDND